MERAVQRIIELGEPYDLELEIITANKNIKCVHTIAKADLKIRKVYSISQDITELNKTENKLALSACEMIKRAREAECLRDITDLLTKKEWGLSFILDSCVRRIPLTWQDSQCFSARIRMSNQIFTSPDFKETEWKILEDIPLNGKGPGTLEVFCQAKEVDQLPFAIEERALIKSIAQQLSQSLERRFAEEKLQLQHNNFIKILNAIPDRIYIVNRDYEMDYINSTVESELGKLDGKKCYSYLHGLDKPCSWCKMEEVFKDKTVHWQWHSEGTGKDYDMLDAPLIRIDGTVSKFSVNHDITFHKLAEEQIRNLSFYDALTQLPNRRMLSERFELAMAASKRSGLYAAAMFLDLNNFKPLNDLYGHKMGDLLLVEVAKRLKSCMREIDTVARFGGDEFVIILSELDKDKAKARLGAGIVAEKVRILLTEPYLLHIQEEGKENSTIQHQCTSSIGVVLFVEHETSMDDIIKHADKAMYRAKEAGRNQISFDDSSTP